VHVRPLDVPAREGRSEMHEQPNFHRAQESFGRAVATVDFSGAFRSLPLVARDS
jgi:hypothetical protein